MKPGAGATVAVTGAAGFIGARVVAYLVGATDAAVRALVRSYSSLSRLAELPQARLSFHEVDLAAPSSLAEAVAGCDVVVHCAYGSRGGVDEQWRVTVDGTAAVVDAARAAGSCRVVHFSTAALYDTAGLDRFDESAPYHPPSGDRDYVDAKLEAERTVTSSEVDWVVLQPTVVFGPWGGDWVQRPLERLRRDVAGLPSGDGAGVCNAVYVDDVARVAVRACVAPVGGRRFLISHPDPPSWGQFYDALRRIARELPALEPNGAGAGGVEPWEEELYRETAVADVRRACAELGLTPAVAFDDGMRRLRDWALWRYGGSHVMGAA